MRFWASKGMNKRAAKLRQFLGTRAAQVLPDQGQVF